MGSRKSKSSKRKSSEVFRSKKGRTSKKKPSRRRHSISSCSDDASLCSSFYSSSSDEEYRSRKSRSRSRADVKRKKRAEKRPSSSQESDDDCKPSKKKRTSRSKKPTRKERPRKKKKRDSWASSSSSDSMSCSSCGYEHSSSEEDGFECRPGKKIRDKRNPDKHKVEAKESSLKPANSLSTHDHSNSYNVSPKGSECVTGSLNNPPRIRSVITVVEHPPEEEEEDLSKCNDGCNGERENKLACHSDAVTDKIDSVQKNICEPTSCVNEDESNNLGESENVSADETTPGSDNLEQILRQKALENLRKFRGKIHEVPMKPESVCNNMLPKQEGPKDLNLPNSGLSPETMGENYSSVKSQITRQNHICEPAIHEKSRTSEQGLVGSAMAEPSSSSNDQAEAKDGEQFQKKTMSVMRSGEMVEVSYKVYIPKRAPALSRRQLKK